MAKNKCDCPQGLPAWLATFADLMSLLLTFFVLLLSFATVSEAKFTEAMMSIEGALGILPANTSLINPMPKKTERNTEQVKKIARELRRQMQIEGRERQVKISYDAMGGLKISLPNSILFSAGSVLLDPAAAPVLDQVALVLSELPDTFIEVKGHTDAQPLTTGTADVQDNYDLSYFRASAVAEYLATAGGIPEEQFERTAAGSSQPLRNNSTPEGRAANRRVDIFIRGLVDKNKVRALESVMEGPASIPGPRDSLISPAEFDVLR